MGECHRKRKSTPQKHEINAHHKQICICPICKPSNRSAIREVGESSLNIVFCMEEFEISQPLQVRVHLFLNFYLSLQQSIFCLLSPIFVHNKLTFSTVFQSRQSERGNVKNRNPTKGRSYYFLRHFCSQKL